MLACFAVTCLVAIPLFMTPTSANAQRLENAVAVFAALDKVTAKIRRLEIPLNETVIFGSLKVTPRVCYSRPPVEPPKTTSFVEIEEVELDGSQHKIFSGWMFAQSPGLNAVEHPVFDIWLTDCEKPTNAPPPETADAGNAAANSEDGQAQPAVRPRPKPRTRRRVRR